MRQIGTLPSEQELRRFANYLTSKEISNTVEPDGDTWAIWVHNEDQVQEARQAFSEFQANPQDRRYIEAAEKAAALLNEKIKRQAQARRQVVDMRSRWERDPLMRSPITFGLVAASVLVAFATQLGAAGNPITELLKIAPPAIDGIPVRWPHLNEIMQGEIWRLISPIFLHFGPLHIIFNMMWMYQLGNAVEALRGSGKYLLFVLMLAITSNLAQYASTGSPNFGGMSGVVFGLFGYVWMKSKHEPHAGFFMPPNTVFWMMAWMVLCGLDIVPNVANTAHVVGLAVGMLAGYARTGLRNLAGH